jgi:hypothetical protein
MRQNFDGDVAAEARIACSIHLAHAACAEWRDDFIAAKAFTCGQEHWARLILTTDSLITKAGCEGAASAQRITDQHKPAHEMIHSNVVS